MKYYKLEVGIFIYFLIVRLFFILLSGLNTGELRPNNSWSDMLSERVLLGNFNFDIGRFIVSPFYNIFIAAHKFVFKGYWVLSLISTQLILSSFSGICLYKIGHLLFGKKVALVSYKYHIL